MARNDDGRKEGKKPPQKTLKEKRAAKADKAEKGSKDA